MASNGLLKLAKKGRCRICFRTRKTVEQVKAVGEVRHGFAVGHIWECINTDECDAVANAKLKKYDPETLTYERIKNAITSGRITNYTYQS